VKTALLVNLPKTDYLAPPAALGILSGVCKDQGWNPTIVDYNKILYESLNENQILELDNWLTEIIPEISDELLSILLKCWDDYVLSHNADLLCISVFSYWSIKIAVEIFQYQKDKLQNNIKVVIGGNGCISRIPGTSTNLDQFALDNKLVNYVVYGDGEPAFINILNENFIAPGINNRNNVEEKDLNDFPTPDYSNFELDRYQDKKVYITGSRGCVRVCTFCDIQNIWPKFRYRSAENIVEEIKKHYYELGITFFDFTDSLINGSISNFYKLNCLLAENKEKNPDLKPISYIGQAIVRPKKHMPEKHYEAMYYGGCKQLTIGIESFAEPVRDHMLKYFSNDDIEYHIKQCSYWGINNIWLMITGYPTETLEDHHDNIKGLYKYAKYTKQGVIEMIRWGTTMHLIEDTPIMHPEMIKQLEIYEYDKSKSEIYSGTGWNWISKKNANLTLKERLRRRIELHELSVELGYPQPRVREELKIINRLADKIV